MQLPPTNSEQLYLRYPTKWPESPANSLVVSQKQTSTGVCFLLGVFLTSVGIQLLVLKKDSQKRVSRICLEKLIKVTDLESSCLGASWGIPFVGRNKAETIQGVTLIWKWTCKWGPLNDNSTLWWSICKWRKEQLWEDGLLLGIHSTTTIVHFNSSLNFKFTLSFSSISFAISSIYRALAIH